mmetsp:Transcript_18153/g.26412  ORF Transcript_18153/g.26412 Transcript_18153/m.26412 type:complete len:165 (+) Transcript_18153:514-1008(+)
MSSQAVDVIFGIFCLVLVMYVIHGLFHEMVDQDEPIRMTKASVVAYAAASFVGGLITGWIGIGIEKVLFMMLTSYDRCNINRACITSISIVGWISMFAFFVHLLILQDIPMMIWLCGLGGVHVGAMVGPELNKLIGPRNVMIIFVVFLIIDVFYKFYTVTHLQG